MRSYNIIGILAFFLFGCTTSEKNVSKNANLIVDTININDSERKYMVDFDEYFSKFKVIALETTPESVIGGINRLKVFEDKIYIIDWQTNSLLVFDMSGKFIFKIKRVGNGQGEYVNLHDFAIDDVNNQIIIYSHRPYKIIYYGLNGEFIKEKRAHNFFDFISYSDGKLLLLDLRGSNDKALISDDEDSNEKKFFLTKTEDINFIGNRRFNTPFLSKDYTVHVTLPFTYTIYNYQDDSLRPKYYLNFKENQIPKELFSSGRSNDEIYSIIEEKKYAGKLGNFRDGGNHIFFTYDGDVNVLYSKRKKTVEIFDFISAKQLPVILSNLQSYDGIGASILKITSAVDFSEGMQKLKLDKVRWDNVPETLKEINNDLESTSNPLLIFCEVKEEF
jgi:hypothetical protein